MDRVENLEQEVQELSSAELAAFRCWFAEAKGVRFPPAILFCAACNKAFGTTDGKNLGLYFACENQEKSKKDQHLSRVILDDPAAKMWLRWERKLLVFQQRFSPFALLRKAAPRAQAGVFVCLSIAVLALVIEFWELPTLLPNGTGVVVRTLLVLLVVWRFVDILLANVSITFTTRFPANPIRSVLYTIAAYLQIALCFAIFYMMLGQGHFRENVSSASSVFFSFGTLTTVGYGDLKPLTNCARFLVVLELIVGLFFVAIIIAQVAGWASASKREAGDYPLGELKLK